MKRVATILAAVAALVITPGQASALVGHSLGFGLHYLHNLGDLQEEDGFDKDSFGIIGSYQFGIPLLTFEGNVEFVPDFLGSNKTLTEPSVYVLTNGLIYFGLGTGIGHIDGEWQSDPFYALRGGANVGIGGLSLDLYTTYRFQSDDDLEELTDEDLDSLTFAAVLRKSIGGLRD